MTTSDTGLYRFTKIPVPPTNASATFQGALDVVLVSIRKKFALVYSSDIVVFAKPPANHIKKIRCELGLLYKAGVNLKLKRRKFFVETNDYLSHVIRPSRVKLAEYTTDGVAKLEHPTTRPTSLRFLVCARYLGGLLLILPTSQLLDKKLRKDQQ